MDLEKRPSKKRKIDPLYLDDYTPVRTIEVTNIADDICSVYLRGYFEGVAGPVSNISIVKKTQDNQEIRVGYVTFVMPEDAAKLICGPNQQLNIKFKKAENAYQPKIDPNIMKFEDINDDCLLHIASYLSLIDIANLAKSSTRLFETVRRFYRKPTHFSYKPFMKQKDMQSILQVIGIHFVSIDWNGLRRSHLDYLSQYCPNVTELKLQSRPRELSLSHIVRNKRFFEKIETLDICDAILSDTEVEIIASSSELKSLQLKSCLGISGTFLSKWKNCKLKLLKIKGCPDIQSIIVLDFIRNNKLVKFSFDENSSFHRCLNLPPECLAELEELELGYSNFTLSSVEFLNFGYLKRLNNLVLESETLLFQNCNQLLSAMSLIPTLKSFTIDTMLIDAHTFNCLESLKNLQTFRINLFKSTIIGTEYISSMYVDIPDDEKVDQRYNLTRLVKQRLNLE